MAAYAGTGALFEQTLVVRYHELGPDGFLRPQALLDWLQDTAGMHTRLLGISVADLRKGGLTWVLSRLHLQLERLPRAETDLLLRTWPSSREGLFTCREFELYDRAENCLARATSSWAVLNVATRRPVRVEGNVPPYPLLERRAIADNFASLPVFAGGPAPEPLDFRVMRSDLDGNRHVNNVRYVNWALEALPDRIAAAHLTGLEVSFRAEALYGDTVSARCHVVREDGDTCTCMHQIANRHDGRELARLRTSWKGVSPA